MQGPSWIALFRRIPAKLHDSLALTLVTGAEIVMQSILRVESEFVILRGRMAGSTDPGRVVVLPYGQIVSVAFTKRMLEPEVQEIFGKVLEPAETQPMEQRAGEEFALAQAEICAPQAEEVQEAVAQGVTMQLRTLNPAMTAAPPSDKAKVAPPSKSILLARLRARLAEQEK